MCKSLLNYFSMDSKNSRLQKKLERKEARAKHSELKRKLVSAELDIRDNNSELYNVKKDFKVDKKIRNLERKTKKAKSQSAYEKMRNELDKSKHARTARKLERQRYKKETRKMRTVGGTYGYKSYKHYGGGYNR